MPNIPYFWEAVFLVGVAWSLMKFSARSLEDVIDPDHETKGTWIEPPDVDVALHDGGMSPAEVSKLSPDERHAAYEALESARAAGAEHIAFCPDCAAPLGAPGIPLGYIRQCDACSRPVHITIADGRPHVERG